MENRIAIGPASMFTSGGYRYGYAPGNKRVWKAVCCVTDPNTGDQVPSEEITFWSVTGQKLGTYRLSAAAGQVSPQLICGTSPKRLVMGREGSARTLQSGEAMINPYRCGLILCVLAISGCGTSSDSSLLKNFNQHRSDFEKLRQMLTEDTQFETVRRDLVRSHSRILRDPIHDLDRFGLSVGRYTEYVKILESADLSGGVSRDDKGNIWFERDRPSFLNGDTTKGYVYSLSEPSPLVRDLDAYVPPATENARRPRFLIFRPIIEHWYLYKTSG